jgi:membrane protease YdiL (CAAX protease family)
MNAPLEPLPVEAFAPPPRPRKGWNKLAWVVICLAVAFVVGVRNVPIFEDEEGTSAAKGEDMALKLADIQMRALVAAREEVPGDAEAAQLYKNALAFNNGSGAQRLRFVVVAGDLVGPGEALSQLDALPRDVLSPDERHVAGVLRELYKDYAAGRIDHPDVSAADAKLLDDQLGWYGRLALNPPARRLLGGLLAEAAGPAVVAAVHDSPERAALLEEAGQTLLVLMGAVVLLLLLAAAGLCAAALFLILWRSGTVHLGLPPRAGDHAGVYAETFAIWLVAYPGLTVAAGPLLGDIPLTTRATAAMLLSLLVVFWPVLRGIPFRQVREDIGWTAGRAPLLEPLLGIACYVVNFPLAVLGFLAMLGLLLLQAKLTEVVNPGGDGAMPTPTHPAFQLFADPSWSNRLQIYFLLSVVAPVVEETFFRGVLYRNVRESLLVRRPVLGALASATLVSFIFAVIHPQGLAAVPALMALAYGFALAREWRETLIPSMVAHGLNNGMVATFGILLFS